MRVGEDGYGLLVGTDGFSVTAQQGVDVGYPHVGVTGILSSLECRNSFPEAVLPMKFE